MISCACYYNEGIITVGALREVTCRTKRKCSACDLRIVAGRKMYVWSMYDFDNFKTVAPLYYCSECGELAGALTESGYCFDPIEPVKKQWVDFLQMSKPKIYKLLVNERKNENII